MKPVPTNLDDYQAMVNLFDNESDRGAAVLAGSYLEAHLGNYLQTKMADPSLTNDMFGSNGALSTFSQRVQVAQAFGFLSSKVCSQLRLIAKIRNHFAHHPKDAKFDADPVKSIVASLKALTPEDSFGSPLYGTMNGRSAYVLTVAMVFLDMHLAEHVRPEQS